MLKMYIDDEEVVSNNDFSIKEEILSASSAILNNLYPKSWETDHIYNTRFYYPKDYSKFVLNDYTHISPEPGSYAAINGSGQIQNVDSTKESELVLLKGDTYQYTTTGKNLFDINGTLYGGVITKYNNGFTLTNNGSYRVLSMLLPKALPSGTYKFTSNIVNSTLSNINQLGIQVRTSSSNVKTFAINSSGEATFTTTSEADRMYFYINSSEPSGATITLDDVMLSVSGGDYEPYTNGASPNPTYPQSIDVVSGLQEVEIVGKNLFVNKPYTLTFHGITMTNNGDSIKFNGTNDSSTYYPSFTFYADSSVSTNVWYASTSNINANKGFFTKNGIDYLFTILKSGTFTGTGLNCVIGKETTIQSFTMYSTLNDIRQTISSDSEKINFISFGFQASQQVDLEYKVQIAKGTTFQTYEPYKGQKYDINLGKNLAETSNSIPTIQELTITNQDNGKILVNGTNTAMRFAKICDMTNINIPQGTYTISVRDNEGNNYAGDMYYTINGVQNYKYKSNGASMQITTDGVITKLSFSIYFPVKTYNNIEIYIQFEKGSQATSYSKYFEPIFLGEIGTYQDEIFKGKGVNLFDTTTTGSNMYVCPCKVGDIFTLSLNVKRLGSDSRFFLRTYNGEYTSTLDSYVDQQVVYLETTDSYYTKTITSTTNGFVYVRFAGGYANYSVSNMQVQYGNVATDYEPYNAKDKWLLHKEIGKYVANNDLTSNGTTETSVNLLTPILNIDVSASASYLSARTKCNLMATMLTSATNNTGLNGTTSSGHIRVNISKDYASDYATARTFLTNKGLTIYYVLANPTTNEITNSELVSQLNAIELIGGLNNISLSSSYLTGAIEIHYNYVIEKEINDLIFSGIVKNTSDISLNPREPKYCSLEILDYKTLLSEGDTLDFVISNKTILEAIEMVVNAISSYGFELGNVNILNGNDIIGTYSTDNKTAYDVLQYLADISGAKWNCRRKDDTHMYIDFYDPTLLPKGKTIEYNNNWWCENNIVDLTFNYGTRDYRNKQVILSNEVYGDIDYTENKVADSYTRDFILGNKIAEIKSITVNGVETTFGTDKDKEAGIYAEFYYQVGSSTVSSNSSNQPVLSGNVISITYTPIIKGREVVSNEDEINRLNNQLEVNGTIARYDTRDDETDTNKLLAIGETYLKYKGEAEITLTLKTFNNDLYEVGQMVHFEAPINELAKDYLVKTKEINIIASGNDLYNIFYTYELSSSFNSEKAVNWFDNQRNKTSGNIKVGEYISRNIDISLDANIIWNNVQIEEITGISGDNKLNSTLNSTLIE